MLGSSLTGHCVFIIDLPGSIKDVTEEIFVNCFGVLHIIIWRLMGNHVTAKTHSKDWMFIRKKQTTSWSQNKHTVYRTSGQPQPITAKQTMSKKQLDASFAHNGDFNAMDNQTFTRKLVYPQSNDLKKTIIKLFIPNLTVLPFYPAKIFQTRDPALANCN